jgi:uncharacterized protein (TIGR00369 family)
MADGSQAWFWRMHRGETPPPPVAGLLGQHIVRVDVEAGELDARFEAPAQFLNPAGKVQGGMLGAMLDAVTASLVDATLVPGQQVATLSLNISYLAPADAGTLEGRARMTRRGRLVAHVAADLLQERRVVATATAVCMIRVGEPARWLPNTEPLA